MSVLALRGAITLDHDTPEEIHDRTIRLLETLYERNGLSHDDIVSIFFTATPDVRSAPPAKSARSFGLVDVPLLCAQEMDVDGALQMCVRLLLHLETDKARSELRHVFLRGAVALRPELAEPGDEA
jgi:chorismate mutase